MKVAKDAKNHKVFLWFVILSRFICVEPGSEDKAGCSTAFSNPLEHPNLRFAPLLARRFRNPPLHSNP